MNLSRTLHAALLLVLALLSAATVHAADDAAAGASERPLILASLAPLYELTLPLLVNTPVELRLLPDSPRSMQSHHSLFVLQGERFAEDFLRADAVLSLASVWSEDPLYTTAREFNIRVVAIDAGRPWSHARDGVALANSPANGQRLLPVWLSLSNAMRMIDIIGRDLQALYPQYAETIRSNQEQSRQRWTSLKSRTELALLELEDPQLFTLADEFTYLSRDLGLYVAGYFIKQDIDWQDADYAYLRETLENAGIKVVLHKWEPSAAIQEAIRAAGAQLVVLDTLETSSALLEDSERNLDVLLAALKGSQKTR